MIRVNFNLRNPNIEKTAVVVTCRWGDKKVVRIGTGLSVYVVTWDKEKQRCFTSRERFSDAVNASSKEVNDFLDEMEGRFQTRFRESHMSDFSSVNSVKDIVISEIDEILGRHNARMEKLSMTPTMFFAKFVEEKRIDSHTGRIIAERTKIHQRTVLKRFEDFLSDMKLLDDWATFRSSKFDSLYTKWCYDVKNYKQNTVYASYGVLKPWLNAAKAEGFDVGEAYHNLKGKGVDVDAIYLTEEEIQRIYELNVRSMIETGDVDMKSSMEQTKDLFVIGCWTGLRRSDLSRLNEAVFDIESRRLVITTEKTKRKVVIPMHPFVVALYKKYEGIFPTLGSRSHTNEHMKEIGRLAKIDSIVSIRENRGGVVRDVKYKKYELIGMHTARRSFATNMFKRGFPVLSIMQLTGHTTEANFLKYIKVSAEENASMVLERFKTFFTDL